jgi:hypothetical protein
MALSALESSKTRAQESVCPHCRRSVVSTRPAVVETVLSVLAGLALALMLVPVAVIVWKSCSDLLSEKLSHSIIDHPLEDWTRY